MSVVPEQLLSERKIPFDRDEFLRQVDTIPELANRRVLYFDGSGVLELRPAPLLCVAQQRTVLVKPVSEVTALSSSSAAAARDSRLYTEVLSGALSCGAAVISWVAVAGTAAATPISGGTSTFLTVLTYGAATASTAQCFNSSVRIYNETTQPEANDWLDSKEWYTTTATVLDVVSLAGAVGATGAAVKAALATRRATGKTMVEVLKGLNRAERRRLTEEIIRVQNPGISNKFLKYFVRSGTYPRRFTQLHISNYMKNQLQGALAAALSYGGSASGGLVRRFAVAVIEEVVVEEPAPAPTFAPTMRRFEQGRAW